MTPGQEALIEAMRLEQARIYGNLCPETKTSSTPVEIVVEQAAPESDTVVHMVIPKPQRDAIEKALARTGSVAAAMDETGASYAVARHVLATMDPGAAA